MDYEALMLEAIREAQLGVSEGEVPIGAAIGTWRDGEWQVVARGRNRGGALGRATAHAEMIAFESLPLGLGQPLVLATTLEPCLMCFGAALVCGIEEIVFAMPAPGDHGATKVEVPTDGLYRVPLLVSGIRELECRALWDSWRESRAHFDLTFIDRLLGKW
ncbi:MAG: nucleoside deaminase [Fimbriimonas sp.]